MFKIKFEIEKSIIINSNVEHVWECITSSKQRKIWSPWLILEEDCKFNTSWRSWKVWFKESWSWEVLWEWEQIITEIVENNIVKYDINFFKPFKSYSKAIISLELVSDTEVKVTWKIFSSIPFYIFFLKNMMIVHIWKDLNRWLVMLKELVETWGLETEIEYKWIDTIKKKLFIWNKWTSKQKDLYKNIQIYVESLSKIVKEHSIEPICFFTRYIKTDIVNDVFEYEVCVEIEEKDYKNFTLPIVSTYFLWIQEESKVSIVTHYWSYDFIENWWTAAFTYLKPKDLKYNKSLYPIELYETSFLEGVKEEDYVTHILIPVK